MSILKWLLGILCTIALFIIALLLFALYRSIQGKHKIHSELYLPDKKLGDWSVNPEVYDFRTPSPIGDLSHLRKYPTVDMEKAKELFIPRIDEEEEEE